MPALPALFTNFAAPLLGYEVLKSHVSHSATALILAGAIPVAYRPDRITCPGRSNGRYSDVAMPGATSLSIFL